jgi:signal transduction histidine kinase
MSSKLREIDQYKAEMMQHITHELRLPLQSLYSAHYLLRKQAPSPVSAEFQKILDLIQENVDRISGFTNQFLDLARIEAGKMEFRREPVDLGEVVARAVQEARVNAERKSIALTQSLQPVPTVMADLEKIHHAVGNLLGNAIKFTQNGGSVHVSLAPTSTGVRCSVRDTGVGIDPEDIPRLFTKFFQAKSAGKISVKGTGIGLALVKGIVEGHGGSVEVESVPGEGSTFSIHLPVNGSGGESTRNVRSIKEDSA